jgi:ATP-dependent DNA helicase RecG
VEENYKVVRLLNILHGPMSVREMMAALGFGSRDKFLKNYLSPALKSGLIEMTQPDTPKSPTQKYRRAQGDM